ncbi:hypothetical protein [Paraburkholderia megapolitana]|uniref:Uncharacterized protein n=1 Tax=Paraburkholderia megapolitana TaxID=420953 RepID=A0A1I3VW99_9BURK|nr:hypothetical protein [Paraburkholderia megapolitana]QDQ82252.1 hypothetical protein FNZ07_13230 [Paraburkholderia megapolitana]SFJ99213.1 hypothetical protein SAMN05192543_1153 [Paraburkholderia megapolitana]
MFHAAPKHIARILEVITGKTVQPVHKHPKGILVRQWASSLPRLYALLALLKVFRMALNESANLWINCKDVGISLVANLLQQNEVIGSVGDAKH